jgi:hypothetical protein
MSSEPMTKNIVSWTAQDVAQLASRLEADEYTTIFDSLKDWEQLKRLQYIRPDLVKPYVHLLELEEDED